MSATIEEMKQMILDLQAGKYRTDDFGGCYKILWIAVILQAIIDLKKGREPYYSDAYRFFTGLRAKKICKLIDFDYNKIMDNLQEQGLL